MRASLRAAARTVGTITHIPRQLWIYLRLTRVTYLEEAGLIACKYPADKRALEELASYGVTVLINLHQRPHAEGALAAYGMTELHVPVPDFTPPTIEQLTLGVTTIEAARSRGERVAVHCGAGLGRTGTLLACYLVRCGWGPYEAIARVRASRPGSVETPQQAAAVVAYAARTVSSDADISNRCPTTDQPPSPGVSAEGPG